MTGPCAKLITVAIIENDGKYWIGTNWCNKPQKKCPRIHMKSGEGYEMCRNVCQQSGHAESNACRSAGYDASGGTLYLIGHIYCCEDCKRDMRDVGIKKVVIGEYPPSWKLNAPIHLITPKKKTKEQIKKDAEWDKEWEEIQRWSDFDA